MPLPDAAAGDKDRLAEFGAGGSAAVAVEVERGVVPPPPPSPPPPPPRGVVPPPRGVEGGWVVAAVAGGLA